MRKRIIISIFTLFIVSACVDDELCAGKGTNEIKLLFVESGTETRIEVALDSIAVSGRPEHYPVIADTTVSAFTLTVDPARTQTQFIFYAKRKTDTVLYGRIDTLILSYEVTPKLISVQCGPELIFSDLNVFKFTFDSLQIIESHFLPEVETNLKIYY